MNAPDRKLVDTIFRDALALSGPERMALIDERCGTDDTLRCRVLALLDAAEQSDAALAARWSGIRDRLWQSVFDEDETAAEDLSGQRVKAWRLERRLARGGLATVYLARRADGHYDQRVAFKVLRRGLDTDDLVARFRAERQILSSLEHPGIARLLDGGALDDGRPFLVLEFVDGLPITEYCESNNVNAAGRVELVMEVLRALHHAHKHLVVHRDIKPSNILVSAEGHVALLDFGIAKLLHPDAMPGDSVMTRTGVSLLTPGYGSPEQHAGGPVTTASDIYQAGVVLSELLTGKRPVVQAVGAGTDAPRRRLFGTGNNDEVRGDFVAIVNKAMHSDPSQRYGSAQELVEDLARALAGRPVLARPDTLGYRFTRFIRRRPWVLPVGIIAVLAVAGYIATLTVYNRYLQKEQKRAAAAQEFIVDLLRSADAYDPADPERGSQITVVEALDIGVERLQSGLYDDPELQASLMSTISGVYRSLDQHQKAIDLREQSLAIELSVYGEQSQEVLDSLGMLANQYKTLGNYQRADEYYTRELAVARSMYAERSPALGVSEASVASFYRSRGNIAGAIALLESAIDKMRREPRAHARSLIGALVMLAGLVSEETPERTRALLDEATGLADAEFGGDSTQTALVLTQLAQLQTQKGDYERALENLNTAIARYEVRLGRTHGATLAALSSLGTLYSRMGDSSHAEQVHREILEYYLAKYGSKHLGVAMSYQNLATAIGEQGRYAEAVALHRRAYDAYSAVMIDNNAVTAMPLLSIAYDEIQLGDHDAAAAAADDALERLAGSAPGSELEGIAACLAGIARQGRGQRDAGAAMLGRARTLLTGASIPPRYAAICGAPAPQ